jgi:hypothetical protein
MPVSFFEIGFDLQGRQDRMGGGREEDSMSRETLTRNKTLAILRALWLLVAFGLASSAFCAEPPAGKVIWWGHAFRNMAYRDQTNGVLEAGEVIASNITDIAGENLHGLALRSDGTVISFGDLFGSIEVPDSVTNVSAVGMSRNLYWAEKRDAGVALWGGRIEGENSLEGLSNVTALVMTDDFRELLVLRKDRTLVEYLVGKKYGNPTVFDPATGQPMPIGDEFRPLHTLTNIAALEDGPVMLDGKGVVFELRLSGSAEISIAGKPLVVGGEILSNVTAIANGGLHHLALKKDGTVVAWGQSYYGETNVPPGLSNVTAIAAAEHVSLALKKDGTVVAWGANHSGQTSVPAGLSNVVKIAAAGWVSMALTTGAVPASVFITPHGRLEEMARKADLIFKGQAISSERITNAAFRISSMEVERTKFKIISVLQGAAKTNYVSFQHYRGWTPGGHAWDGPHTPAFYRFDPGQCYLVYAANLSRKDEFSYYDPAPNTRDAPDEFREIADYPKQDDDGVTRTLDARPVRENIYVKEAHWTEFNLLLHDTNAVNRLYAIQHLDWLSKVCGDSWGHTDDFKRPKVLEAVSPLINETNDGVAIAAINCFHVGGECSTQLVSYIPALLWMANDTAQSVARRVAAIDAFSGANFPVLTNSLPAWLADPSDHLRSRAVLLLADRPGEFSERHLRERAADSSPKVRASVADAIGNGKIVSLLPTLEMLLKDPVGLTNPVPPVTIEDVRAAEHIWSEENVDVHLASGYALLKFDRDQVTDILKANLNDPGFRPKYLCKLAETNAGPWIPGLADALDSWRADNEKKAKTQGGDLRNYMYLSGTYAECWKTIYKYLDGLELKEFANNQQDRYLDTLEKNCSVNGNQYPLMVYELYRKKNLNERATRFRAAMEKEMEKFRIKEAFDQVDWRLTNSVGK